MSPVNLNDVNFNPKPAARIVADREGWQRIVDLKDGPCRAGTGSHWVDYAHLVSRAQGGDDVPDNIIPLGHEAHMLWHDRGKGWEHVAHMIRESLTREEKEYVLIQKGSDWLEQNYPKGDTGPLCSKCRRPVKAKDSGEKPRPRKTLSIRVPDDAEDGAALLRDLMAQAAEQLGRESSTPPYFTLVEVLYFFLSTPKEHTA